MKRGILVLLIAVAGTLYVSLRSIHSDEIVPREKLSSVINSDYQEVRPLISANGMTLYFSRRHHPENIGGIKDFQDIWVSHYVNGAWSQPTNLGAPINNKKTNTLCSITIDGKYVLLLDGYKRVKTPLAQAYNSSTGWGAPGNVIIKDFTNFNSYYDFYYHEQSMVLVMAIDNGRGSGEQDLFISFKQDDGSYSPPKNLGKTINTRKADFAPFLAADGITLYFASFGHDGLGGSDLYVSQRLDDSWIRWSEPINLGPGINSEQDENYLSVTGDYSYVYFESYPPGSEEKDIYRAPLPKQFHPKHLTQHYLAEMTKDSTELMSNPESTVVTKPGAESKFSVISGNEPVDPTLVPNPTPAMGSPDFFTTESKIHLGSLKTRQYFEQGQVINKLLNNTYFPFNSYQLSADCILKLNEISDVLQEHPTLQVHLEGHADSWGLSENNLRLSYLRAQTAAHYLIDQGISVHRLRVTSRGEKQPLASNDDERDGRELNRRVEITLRNTVGVYKGYSLN